MARSAYIAPLLGTAADKQPAIGQERVAAAEYVSGRRVEGTDFVRDRMKDASMVDIIGLVCCGAVLITAEVQDFTRGQQRGMNRKDPGVTWSQQPRHLDLQATDRVWPDRRVELFGFHQHICGANRST